MKRLFLAPLFFHGLTCAATAQQAELTERVQPFLRAVAGIEALGNDGDPTECRQKAAEALERFRALDAEAAAERSVQDALWELGFRGYETGALRVAHDAWTEVEAHRAARLESEDPDLLAVRMNLAVAKCLLGEIRGADALFEQIHEIRARTLPDDDPELQSARMNLAGTKRGLGDFQGAHDLESKVVSVYAKTLTEEHPALLGARVNLAGTKCLLGDLRGADELLEQCFAILSRTRDPDDPDLRAARVDLGVVKAELGDLERARELFEQSLVDFTASRPDDDPELQGTRQNLAAVRRGLGDLYGALALETKVLQVRTKTLPDDHPDLQSSRLNLASTKTGLGDLHGALALTQKALAAYERNLPDDHPDVLSARMLLAATLADLGDAKASHEILEEVLTAYSAILPDDHPDLQSARTNAALSRRRLGDLEGALALQEKVYEVQTALFPDDHADVQYARLNLAESRRLLGDLEGALRLEEQVYAVFSKTLPAEHPNFLATRGSLIGTRTAIGDVDGALTLALEQATISRQSIARTTLSSRGTGARAAAETHAISLLGSLHDLVAEPAELASAALLTDAYIRSAETRSARIFTRARRRAPERFESLRLQLREAVDSVQAATRPAPGEAGQDAPSETGLPQRNDRLLAAVEHKESLETEIAKLALGDDAEAFLMPTTRDLAAALEARAAAVSILAYTHWTKDPDRPWLEDAELRFAGLVLDSKGSVSWCNLGPAEPIRALVEDLRRSATARGDLAVDATARGERATPSRKRGGDLKAIRQQLGQRVFDPILAAIPADTETLALSVDDSLLVVPMGSFLLASGVTLAERFREIQQVASLIDLVDHPNTVPSREPRLVALGGIDYGDAIPGGVDGASPGSLAATNVFAPLSATATEITEIAAAFQAQFGEERMATLSGSDASKRALTATGSTATFLHVATHGYFAPESAWRAAEVQTDQLERFSFDPRTDTVSGLSPFSLSGLALAGANLPPDDLGRLPGIITAAELAQLDLSGCFLATISACESALGARKAGSGYASLRSALHAAGARFVLASLWRVGDAPARDLMADFYRRLWSEGHGPYDALRDAKAAARARGVAYADWAAWQLTGR